MLRILTLPSKTTFFWNLSHPIHPLKTCETSLSWKTFGLPLWGKSLGTKAGRTIDKTGSGRTTDQHKRSAGVAFMAGLFASLRAVLAPAFWKPHLGGPWRWMIGKINRSKRDIAIFRRRLGTGTQLIHRVPMVQRQTLVGRVSEKYYVLQWRVCAKVSSKIEHGSWIVRTCWLMFGNSFLHHSILSTVLFALQARNGARAPSV